jgi:2-dehydro-3-deoxygalactonokinase
MTARLIALDWGTTSLRAYLLDDVSRVVEERTVEQGILNLPEGGFEAAFAGICGDWRAAYPNIPSIACGMVGSRQGWHEVPYQSCPADQASVAASLGRVALADDGELLIVPGLAIDPPDSVPDVLRGEETQVFGAVRDNDSATVILPGTHSKWVSLIDGRIDSFATFMTGELYELLSTRSILATMMDGDAPDPDAFDQGVRAGVDGFAADGVLHHLFGVRTLALFDRLAPRAAAAYLSGLLIGAEIGGATRGGRVAPGARIIVLGDLAMTERYLDALSLSGLDGEPGPQAAAAAGLFRLASRAGLQGF